MANATYITGIDTVIAHIRRQLEQDGRAEDVTITTRDRDEINGGVIALRERNGELWMSGKQYAGSEFELPLSEVTELTIFDYPDLIS